jgi:hypothetical protein
MAGILLSSSWLEAQTQSTQPDSIVQITAEAEGLSQVAPADLPPAGCYWTVTAAGNISPWPCLISGPIYPIYAITDDIFLVDATGGQLPTTAQLADLNITSSTNAVSPADALGSAVADLIEQIQEKQMLRDTAMLAGVDLDPGDAGDGTGGTITNSFTPLVINTNLLWLEITNVAAGSAYANLHVATNQIYAIWSTPDLSQPFTVEMELWPTDTNCQPFTVALQSRPTLFLRAEDWTGLETNGLPLWWVWKYFGDFSESATNFDSLGMYTLGYDSTNNLDPNILTFTVRLGNRHFNTSTANGTFSVSAGTPSFEAVLVNPTNFDNAVWQPYDGNINIPLTSGDGAYQVWFGLKGRAPDSTPTWMGTTIYLDQTPPNLTITNPASSTVALPYIQLQGWATEPLAKVTYDLSNAVGVVTGQVGYVTGQFLDTNSLTFTTNYFQCFDVPLAEGANVITVYGTDLAGNTGSVTTNFTLDYSTATNPPTITLVWPQDGMQIGQSNITVYGTISDPTASISLQVTDGAGGTNTVAGVVERDGHFWIQNVPLTGATNTLTLTAQDVRTNTATMILNVAADTSGGLSIAGTTGDLWDGMATVNGTIADDSSTVTVNGIVATHNGGGSWTAHNVPVNPENMAIFTVAATASGTTNPVFVQLPILKPAAIKLTGAIYHDENMSVHGDDVTLGTFDTTLTWGWAAGKGGFWHRTGVYIPFSNPANGGTYEETATISADRMLSPIHHVDSAPETYDYSLGGYGPWSDDFPQEVGSLMVISPTSPYWWETRSADACWNIEPGIFSVASGPKPNAFLELNGTATSEVAGIWSASGTIVDGPEVLGPDITNTGEKESSDNIALVPVKDSAPIASSMTTTAAIAKLGNVKIGTPQPIISWTGGAPITNTQNVVVGQKISLTCTWNGAGPLITNYSWTVPGITFSDYVASVSSAVLYKTFPTTNSNVAFYWVDGGAKQLSCTVIADGKPFTANASFQVTRPHAALAAAVTGEIRADNNYFRPGTYLHFGGYYVGTNAIHGIKFQISGADVAGDYFFIQTGSIHEEQLWSNGTNYVGDSDYGVDNGVNPSSYIYPLDSSQGTNATGDSPGSELKTNFQSVTKSDAYAMYLMFTPANVGTAEPVPLQKVNWTWSATAIQTNATLNLWRVTNAIPPSEPAPMDCTSHPEWSTNVLGSLHWTP